MIHQEVRNHYAAGDHNLAHRRLLDAALETRNPTIFREVLQYADQHDNNKTTPRQALDLLDKIEAATHKTIPTSTGNHLLSVNNLGKRYTQGSFSLTDVSLELNAGGIIGLVGENGNGKTTLLRLIATELKPDSGTISYPFIKDAEDDYDLRTRLVYIEQRIPRWWGSLMDNLQFTLAHYGLRGNDNLLWAEMMIARLGLRPFRQLTWARLSSGYRTRFELAKTLLRQPKILLLDEPLANLDILSQQTILQDLRYMARSTVSPFGMLLSSQHIYEVEKVSDRIIFLKSGKPQYSAPADAAAVEEAVAAGAPLIYEMEALCTRDTLAAAFSTLSLEGLSFNGGVFIVQFAGGTGEPQVLRALADAGIPLQYLRNISASSRRFFLN
jgi:ABC-2 type transport system ATP-binding protein